MIATAPTLRAAKVYCPLCTHTVDARAISSIRRTRVDPGQRCPRCTGSLDAGYIVQLGAELDAAELAKMTEAA